MAYRRRRSTTASRRRRAPARRATYRRAAPRRRTTRTATRRRAAPQTLRIVVQSDPSPQLGMVAATGETVQSVRETAPAKKARF